MRPSASPREKTPRPWLPQSNAGQAGRRRRQEIAPGVDWTHVNDTNMAALARPAAGAGAHACGTRAARATDPALPPPVGPGTPHVEPSKEEDGFYHARWFEETFLDLREDFAEAKASGRRFAIIFEQSGCPYCIKLHTEVLAAAIHQRLYARKFCRSAARHLGRARGHRFRRQGNCARRALAERWGVIFTPTVVFFKDDLAGLERQMGAGARGDRAPAVELRPRHLLRPLRVGAPQALRARQELPALPYFAHRRARSAEREGAR